MKAVLYAAPAIEPVSLAEAKLQIKVDSETLAGNLTTYQSIVPGSHGISAGGLYTHVGTGVSVIGKTAIVNLNAGTVGTDGTVDAKIQESDDNVTYTDWTGGGFTQVTSANDNAIQEKAYTGSKAYIRVVAKVLVAACEFGAEIIVDASTSADDDLITAIITAARQHVENHTRRALISQTWKYYLDAFPEEDDFIKLPFGNLSATDLSITYKDSDGTSTTMTLTTDYLIETNGDQCGRIVLPYGVSWPSATLYPSNPITITFTCGYGAASTDVPSIIRTAIKMTIAKLYMSRGDDVVGTIVEETGDKAVTRLLASYRLWDEF